MRYIIKVGSQYLTSKGSLSDSQRDALRVNLETGQTMRAVKLTPNRSSLHRDPTPMPDLASDSSIYSDSF